MIDGVTSPVQQFALINGGVYLSSGMHNISMSHEVGEIGKERNRVSNGVCTAPWCSSCSPMPSFWIIDELPMSTSVIFQQAVFVYQRVPEPRLIDLCGFHVFQLDNCWALLKLTVLIYSANNHALIEKQHNLGKVSHHKHWCSMYLQAISATRNKTTAFRILASVPHCTNLSQGNGN